MHVHHCSSVEDTMALGEQFGKELPKGAIVCFFGDLGAGKTTFIKGLVSGAAKYSADDVNSPTFVYLNIYAGDQTIYHFDLYRLRDTDEFLSMGFDEYLFADGICCIEWSEKIASLLPNACVKVLLEQEGETARKITITHYEV